MIKIFDLLKISESGMEVQKKRMEIIAENIANAETLITEKGSFYKRKTPIFEEIVSEEIKKGVKIKEIIEEKSVGILRYEPYNPLADKDGFVRYPEISIVKEMTDLISAQRAYEANLAVFSSWKAILNKTLEI